MIEMDLKTRIKVLPCTKCEDMLDCETCNLEKEAIELYNQIRAEVIEEFCEGYKNFQIDENICDLQEDCSFSDGWCIDCFKDKWLKEDK